MAGPFGGIPTAFAHPADRRHQDKAVMDSGGGQTTYPDAFEGNSSSCVSVVVAVWRDATRLLAAVQSAACLLR